MIDIQIDESIKAQVDAEALDPAIIERAASVTLGRFPANVDGDLSILLSDDTLLQQLNAQFLGIDAPTDVLSFPEDYIDPDSGVAYLGDIAISYPRAKAQAEAGGYAAADELQLLAVHGVLHLLGFDHAENEEKQKMWQVQRDILIELGCAVSLPPEEAPSA